MDYFYLSTASPGDKKGGQAMSIKELQRRFREMRKSDKGSRQDLVKTYDKEVSKYVERDDGEEYRHDPVPSHATENPMIVVVDESTRNKYMRAVDHQGPDGQGDNSWLVRDMHE